MELAFTLLIAAGAVSKDDNKMMMIQGLSTEQARAIGEWLVVATGGSVVMRHLSPLEGGMTTIELGPEDIVWKTMLRVEPKQEPDIPTKS
jgi:hypothetical protein